MPFEFRSSLRLFSIWHNVSSANRRLTLVVGFAAQRDDVAWQAGKAANWIHRLQSHSITEKRFSLKKQRSSKCQYGHRKLRMIAL